MASVALIRISDCTIKWFSKEIPIKAHVFVGKPHPRGHAVIGTRLLLGYILTVDFNEGVVHIHDPQFTQNPA